MTPEQHLRIGIDILGFPRCCVEAWVDGLDSSAPPNRGVVVERRRTIGEAFALAASVSALLGVRWPFATDSDPEAYARNVLSDLRKAYVPCPACAGPHTPGWQP